LSLRPLNVAAARGDGAANVPPGKGGLMQTPLEIAFVDTSPSSAVEADVRKRVAKLAVSSRPGNVEAHEDVHVAVRDAFDAMERQLKERQGS
jgi:hypothetical protein